MKEKRNILNQDFDPLVAGAISTEPEDFKTYNDFVEAKVKDLPDYLVILLPTDGGPETLQMVQIVWINDFWKSRKKLVV